MSTLIQDLEQFKGTEQWYRFNPLMKNVLATEGAMYLAKNAKAYWLLDIVASLKLVPKCAEEAFIVCKLEKKPNDSATFKAEDGNNNVLYVQEIPYTDFPLNEIKLFFTGDVVMLPSEY
ncbi:MAG: DUF6876 family protein [Bacteroidota bacterium]